MRAINHDKGPACVIAGPGSGKTFVIIQRIINLIRKGVSPGSILTITFTKAAAIEMQQRFIKETDSMYPEVLFGTFHSIFYHILDNRNLTIIKEKDKYKLLSHILHGRDYDNEMIKLILSEISRLKNCGGNPEERDKSVPFYEDFPEIQNEYNVIMKEQGLIDFDDMIIYCKEYLLQRPDIRKKWQNRLQYIQIDEYQDINKTQFEVVKLLLNDEKNLFVVGDDDQSIYGFRGSDPKIMLGFKEEFQNSKEIILDTNYRCSKKILKASMQVIEENKIRFKKNIVSGKTGSEGMVEGLSYSDKKEQYVDIIERIRKNAAIANASISNCHVSKKVDIDYSDTAIIVRTNTEATVIARMLNESGIPCSYKEKILAFHEKNGVRDLIAYMSFVFGGQKRTDFLKIMNKPLRYISRNACFNETINEKDLVLYYAKEGKISMTTTVQRLFKAFRLLSKLSPKAAIHFIRGYMGYDRYVKEKYISNIKLYKEIIADMDEFEKICSAFDYYDELSEYLSNIEDELREMKKIKVADKKGIRVMTMHASKGLEFKKVYLPDLNEGIIPSRKSITKEELEEERRMLYVAMTRAKDELYISYVKGTKENPMRMSAFLRPIKGIFQDSNYCEMLIK
ncbi:ATP-dependent helicase [Butyrivibrio sp. AE3004]|uniref:ATP-dependent helicase n=1 Tax=Butyrivibrio sp. AE3004 TaxID=1506994 RepID=UPI00068CC1F5|nr:ATP-dependent helicase [Butyrivibrio sp. AE3004]